MFGMLTTWIATRYMADDWKLSLLYLKQDAANHDKPRQRLRCAAACLLRLQCGHTIS
jgi:hypothetical protein